MSYVKDNSNQAPQDEAFANYTHAMMNETEADFGDFDFGDDYFFQDYHYDPCATKWPFWTMVKIFAQKPIIFRSTIKQRFFTYFCFRS